MKTESALDVQVAGDHYKKLAIQPVEYIHANGIGYFEGNVIKYVSRWRDKNGLADLEKAKHYLELLIELESHSKDQDQWGDGWVQWGGGECPVDLAKVVGVKLRDGTVYTRRADDFLWGHDGVPGDIISYRVFDDGK